MSLDLLQSEEFLNFLITIIPLALFLIFIVYQIKKSMKKYDGALAVQNQALELMKQTNHKLDILIEEIRKLQK
jgi:hypothetical protein